MPQPWVRHYQPGVPALIEEPTESLVALYERSVAEAGDADMLALAQLIQKTLKITQPIEDRTK